MHQARIEIRSEPGQGSTFTALFPAARMLLPVAAADAAPAD